MKTTNNNNPATVLNVETAKAELIASYKANPQDLYKAVAMKKSGVMPYDKTAISQELRTEIMSMTFVEKLAALDITVAAGETKKAAKAVIAKEPKAPKAEKQPVVTTDIATVLAGSVITYGTSKKPYIVSEVNEKGRMLFSATQKFFSSKPSFPVVVVHAGTGELPVQFEDAGLNDLLAQATAELKDRQAKELAQATAKAEKDAAKAAKAAAAAVVTAPVVELSIEQKLELGIELTAEELSYIEPVADSKKSGKKVAKKA